MARNKMATIVAHQHISLALSSRLSPDKLYLISPGDLVRVYPERSKAWEGPFVVCRIGGRQVWIQDRSHRVLLFNVSQLLPDPKTSDGKILQQ